MDSHPDNAHLPVSNKPATIQGVTITFLVIGWIAANLRLYVRLKNRLWGWDDWFIVFAGVSVTVGSALTFLMPADGLGKHFWTLSEHNVVEYYKHIWATNITYTIGTTFIKLAILFQYLRMFTAQQQTLARRLTLGMLTFTALWGLTFSLLALFSCSPVAKNWNFKLEGKCVAWGSKNPNIFFATWVAHSASNMMIDVLVFVLPIPFIPQLRMTGKTRAGLIALFIMGGIVVVLSVARLISLTIHRAGTVPIYDPTYSTPNVYIFSVLEINVAILCASIPIFWPLVTSLAANKILIVNEVVVRTEKLSDNIALAGHGKDSPPSYTGFTGIPDMDFEDGRTSRVSIGIGGEKLSHTLSRPARAASRLHRHTRKPSTSHSMQHNNLGIDFGARSSQDSQRNLNLSHQSSEGSFSSSSPELPSVRGTSPDAKMNRYHEGYMQEWGVPDFQKNAKASKGTYTTTVERAEIPYDHIRALEK